MSTINHTSSSNFEDLSKITTYQSGVIQSAAHRNLKKVTDDALAEHKISTMQWFIIGIVYDSGDNGIRITELAKQVGTTLGFLTNAINLLESRKILIRVGDTEDSRAKLVCVAPSYRNKCRTIEEDLRNKLRKSIYSQISYDDLRTYIKVLHKFANLG